ncbi:ABC transporter permease [Polynucleobacter paneuropaeus]|nr:ABC transporter permease [Polynucleobacter paneuropaeus]
MSNPIVVELTAKNGPKFYWKDLWAHRELLYFLTLRDILVRYKQTILGVGWVIVRPLLTMIVFTIVFGKIANLSSGDVPYALLVFTGLLPWTFFSNALSETANSLLANSHLLAKVYFPRLIVPASTVLVCLVDFVVSFSMLFALMLYYGIAFTPKFLLIPLFVLLTGFLSFGFGLFFATLTVKYRDFRHIIPFLLQLGVYVSPVGYSISLVPEKWQSLYYLNPMVGVIDCFRWAILDTPLNYLGAGYAAALSLLLIWGGVHYFRTHESSFADEF